MMPMKRVCLACGKVEGEHRGWDVSCALNSEEFDDATHDFIRDDSTGRVLGITPPLPFEDEPNELEIEEEILRMEREVRFRNDNDPED